MMKKYNSLIDVEDIGVRLPRTDCTCNDVRNHSHEMDTNYHGHHDRDTRSYAQVHFMGDILKKRTGYKSKNPSTWRF